MLECTWRFYLPEIGNFIQDAPDKQIVKFKPSSMAAMRASAIESTVLNVPADLLQQKMADLKLSAEVASVEPDYTTNTSVDDPYAAEHYALDAIQAYQARDIPTGATDQIIAIIDTGVDLTHLDLTDKIVAGYDFGHGTHVAGIAATVYNNTKGIAEDIMWAADQGANVINLSVGSTARPPKPAPPLRLSLPSSAQPILPHLLLQSPPQP